ncbi:MAG: hypothetical protein WD971_10395, partial [Pirellulales bacterium]
QTDLSFLRWLVDDPTFVEGAYDTDIVAQRWGRGPDLGEEERSLAALAAGEARLEDRHIGCYKTRPCFPAARLRFGLQLGSER